MFRAFIDDTQNDPRQRALYFAAWVASDQEWDKFSRAWESELHTEPSIKYFKHHEAKGQTGEFEGWNPLDCDRKILSLARVIVDHDVYGFISETEHAIMRELFEAVTPPIKVVRSILKISGAYDWCFYSITSCILQHQVALGATEKVDFVFDKGDGAFENCAANYREFRDTGGLTPAMLAVAGTVTTGDDKSLQPLQAADLLAGQFTVKERGATDTDEAFKLLATNKIILLNQFTRDEPILEPTAAVFQRVNAAWTTEQKSKAE